MTDVSTPKTRRLLVIGDWQRIAAPDPLAGIEAKVVAWTGLSPARMAQEDVDLIVPIVETFGVESEAFFKHLSQWGAPVPVLVVLPSDHHTSDQFALALSTADDFMVMPVRPEEWHQRVFRLTEANGHHFAAVGDRLTGELGLSQLVGRAPPLLEVLERIPMVARCGSPALITGETGTGKELCGRAIHLLSSRRSQPFIPVDCAALPDSLFENEFFGHVRGAFTDAHRDQRGLVGLAEGGTLFLDEVDSLSLPAQAKLLRFLQERCFRPLGSERFARANVHVLAAMNRDPETLVRDNLFRADLFFRLDVVRLHLVPLRDRLSDIPLLARHFVASFSAEIGLGPKTLSPGVMPKLMAYDWPGNIRQLNNVLQRAVVLSPDRQILAKHVSLPVSRGAGQAADSTAQGESLSFRRGRSMVIEEFERTYVTRLIEKHGGNVTHAAREAQKDRRAFGRLLKKHGIRGASRPG